MFSHVLVGTNDLERATRFYDAVLGTLGHPKGQRRVKGDYIYASDAASFIVTRPINGRPASPANGGTIGFVCQSRDQVDLWHVAGMGPTAANPSRTHPAYGIPRLAPCISPTCAIPTTTSCAAASVRDR